MVALHQMISASLISSLQAQARSEQLVIMLAQDQVLLAEANEQLSTSNASSCTWPRTIPSRRSTTGADHRESNTQLNE